MKTTDYNMTQYEDDQEDDQEVDNPRWPVGKLVGQIENGSISKPQFQRKKKWTIHPSGKSVANERSYIEFLYRRRNTVHSISFGKNTFDGNRVVCSNIDGNNRINAICHFMKKPFEIFNDYLDDLSRIITMNEQISDDEKEHLHSLFSNMSYIEFMNFTSFSRQAYEDMGLLEKWKDGRLPLIRDDIDDELTKLRNKLKVGPKKNRGLFNDRVMIPVNIFEEYTTDELCRLFEEINKFGGQLTETELLACRLFNETNFVILNKQYETAIREQVVTYYKEKAKGEVLECFTFGRDDTLNAHDLIIGFQNLCSEKYKFIPQSEVQGISLFFKMYKQMYKFVDGSFTTENINNFIQLIDRSCELLNEIISDIFDDRVDDALFNKSCKTKLQILKKNNVYIILSALVGFSLSNEPIPTNTQKRHVTIALMFFFMTKDVKNHGTRKEFSAFDTIRFDGGGCFVESKAHKMMNSPQNISEGITKQLFGRVIDALYQEVNNPHVRFLDDARTKRQNDKRRQLRFFEKVLMFFVYKDSIPVNMLKDDFSIEHIVPNSSEWDGNMDKDRTGNLVPIRVKMNCSRGNKHINVYNGNEFCNCVNIRKIIPTNDVYDEIVDHVGDSGSPKRVRVKDVEKYNNMCARNENIYKEVFLEYIFPE